MATRHKNLHEITPRDIGYVAGGLTCLVDVLDADRAARLTRLFAQISEKGTRTSAANLARIDRLLAVADEPPIENLLEQAYDAEKSGNASLAASLRALYHSQQHIDQAAPVVSAPDVGPQDLPVVRAGHTQDEHGTGVPYLEVGDDLTEVRVYPEDDKDQPGVLLVVGGSCINEGVDEVLTPADVCQLRDNLTAILTDPRFLAASVQPAPLVRPVPFICDDTVDKARYGKCVGTDWATSAGDPENAPYVYVPNVPDEVTEHPISLYLPNGDAIPLADIERWLPQIAALVADPRVQAAREQYEAARTSLMKKAA